MRIWLLAIAVAFTLSGCQGAIYHIGCHILAPEERCQ